MSGKAMLDRFCKCNPLAVMARAIVAALLSDGLEELFEDNRGRQYTDVIEFSTIAMCMGEIALGTLENRNQAYKKYREELGTSVEAFYTKINRTTPKVSEALVQYSADQASAMLHHLEYEPWEALEGYRVFALDGNHLQKTEKRLKESRDKCAAPLPGTVVARFDIQQQLFDRAYVLEDAHEQEPVVLGRAAEDVGEGDVILADRNFCVVSFMQNLASRKASFAIRHNARLKGNLLGTRKKAGRSDTGMVYEQSMAIGDKRKPLVIRRITVELEEPTRDGDMEVHVLTNIPSDHASAVSIANLYHTRWDIENAFYRLTTALTCELKGNCHPRCALLLFCMAMFAFNCHQILFAALYAEHDEEAVEQMSHFYISRDIQTSMAGMLIAITEEEWSDLTPRSTRGLARFLRSVSRHVKVSDYRKSVRGPKKPPPKRKRCKSGTHLSAHRLIKSRSQRC